MVAGDRGACAYSSQPSLGINPRGGQNRTPCFTVYPQGPTRAPKAEQGLTRHPCHEPNKQVSKPTSVLQRLIITASPSSCIWGRTASKTCSSLVLVQNQNPSLTVDSPLFYHHSQAGGRGQGPTWPLQHARCIPFLLELMLLDC